MFDRYAMFARVFKGDHSTLSFSQTQSISHGFSFRACRYKLYKLSIILRLNNLINHIYGILLHGICRTKQTTAPLLPRVEA